MEDQRSRLDGLIRSLLIVSALVSLCLFLFDNSPAADECEIVKAVFYERKQGEIVTDLDSGIPCRRYQVVTCPCAMLTIRDNSRLMYSKDIEVEATFADQATRAKKAWCDKKQREERRRDLFLHCMLRKRLAYLKSDLHIQMIDYAGFALPCPVPFVRSFMLQQLP